jgi:hypothetical protein
LSLAGQAECGAHIFGWVGGGLKTGKTGYLLLLIAFLYFLLDAQKKYPDKGGV